MANCSICGRYGDENAGGSGPHTMHDAGNGEWHHDYCCDLRTPADHKMVRQRDGLAAFHMGGP